MINFDNFREEIKQIQKQRKSNDVFIKQTLLGFLKDTCIQLRDVVDVISDTDANFQIERATVEYGYIYNVVYHYQEPGYLYNKQIKVFTVLYYPGGDLNLEVNLWSTNEYEGTTGMIMRENLLKLLVEYNILSNVVKQLQTLLPMIKDLQTKQNKSERNMWKAYRSKTDEMFGMVNSYLIKGEFVTLTSLYDFTYGKTTFTGDVVCFSRTPNKRIGQLTIHNTLTQESVSWNKVSFNSVARISRDIVHHERKYGE